MSEYERELQISLTVTDLIDGMVDLSWELERMSSSGEETYEKMRKALMVLVRLIDEQNQKGEK
jgi:hypothetical protein